MRFWHTAAITTGLAILYAPVFVPSLSPLPLVACVVAICLLFAVLDGLVFAIGAMRDRRPSWRTIALVNAGIWLLAWIV